MLALEVQTQVVSRPRLWAGAIIGGLTVAFFIFDGFTKVIKTGFFGIENKHFDSVKGGQLLNEYLDEKVLAEELGFDGNGVAGLEGRWVLFAARAPQFGEAAAGAGAEDVTGDDTLPR